MSNSQRTGPDLELRIQRDSKLWVELKNRPEKMELRLGIDDLAIFEAKRRGNGAYLFAPAAKSSRHLTLLADPEARRLTVHETIQHVDVIGGASVLWNENAKPVLVLTGPYVERRTRDERFLAAFRTRIERACRFIGRPRDFRGEGISAVFPVPTAADFRPVSGTRYELELAKFTAQPVEALWRSAPSTIFFAIGDNLKLAGATTLLPDDRAVLLRYREIFAIYSWFIRALSEPASPPLDLLADL